MNILVMFLFFSFSLKAQECLETFRREPVVNTEPLNGTSSVFDNLELWRKVIGVPKRDHQQDFYEELSRRISEAFEEGYNSAIIDGDRIFYTISAVLEHYPNVKILWIDAHAGLKTRKTSPSGNTHGKPLAELLNLMGTESWNSEGMNPILKPENIIYIGLRELYSGEEKLIKKLGIKSYPMNLVREYGIERILSEIRQKWKGASIHMSFDIDSLDPSLAPATGTPVSDGLSLEAAIKIIEAMKPQLVSFELIGSNPELVNTTEELKQTQESVETLLKSLISSTM